MANKTVISKYTGMEAVDGIIEFPQDKTLYVDQFTDKAPLRPGEVFKPQTLEQVFDHFKPEKKNVQMLTREGSTVKENFQFHAVSDFEDDKLIEQSPYLSAQQAAGKAYQEIEYTLTKNNIVKEAIMDDDIRPSLVSALKALLAELQQS